MSGNEDAVTREAEKELDKKRAEEAKKANLAQPSFFKDLAREKTVTMDMKTGVAFVKISYRFGVDLAAVEEQVIGDVEQARVHLRDRMDKWIDEELEGEMKKVGMQKAPKESAMPQEAISVSGIPKIDPAELDECEWLTFGKPRQQARPGTAAGISNPTYFTDFEAPPVLLELTKALAQATDHRLVIGDMEYSLGGKDEMKDHFINRKPVKTEGAR